VAVQLQRRDDGLIPTSARSQGVEHWCGAGHDGEPLDVKATYSYASYYFDRDPKLINVVPAADISVLKDEQGNVLDGVEVVVRYLQSLPDRTANPDLNRIRIVKPLPQPQFKNPEVQPLRGAIQ
jgi:hypothetical protein